MPLSFLVGIVRVMAPCMRCCDQVAAGCFTPGRGAMIGQGDGGARPPRSRGTCYRRDGHPAVMLTAVRWPKSPARYRQSVIWRVGAPYLNPCAIIGVAVEFPSQWLGGQPPGALARSTDGASGR